MIEPVSISLFFVDSTEPVLSKVLFRVSSESTELLSVRGKTGGAFDTERTFQWTAAVQGLSVVLLRWAASPAGADHAMLAGGQGSVAASLDYALDKQPAWLCDMFGVTSEGNAVARKIFRRTNPGRKSRGPVVVGINKAFSSELVVHVFWEGAQVLDKQILRNLLLLIEKISGAEPLAANSDAQEQQSAQQSLAADKQATRHDLFKTPFILRYLRRGEAFTRLYQHCGSMYHVVSFSKPDELSRPASTPVRIQFECSASSMFQWVDCDCATQLDETLDILQAERGLLIYVVPEKAPTALFSSYLAASGVGRGVFSAPLVCGAAREREHGRSIHFDIIDMILRDMDVSSCQLLTNNPTKIGALRARNTSVAERPLSVTVTPQNIGALYPLYKEGIQKHITRHGEVSYCLAPWWHTRSGKAWIIGGEDTLWEDNIYYEDLIRKFIDHISNYLGDDCRAKVRKILDGCSLANTRENGFGPFAFEGTLKLTWETLRQTHGETFNVPYPEQLINQAASTLFQIPLRVHTDGEDLLWRIKRAGDRVVLFTQGPLEIQLLKTAQLSVGPLFDAIAYAPRKTPETFRQLLTILRLDPSLTTVVGNNLATEVQPAIDLGIEAIHYDNPNGWASLSQESSVTQGFRKIRSLRAIFTEVEASGEGVGAFRRSRSAG